LRFSVHGEPRGQHPLHALRPAEPAPVLYCWPTGPHVCCCGTYPIGAKERDCHPRFSLAG
jgi:hypothetical protein